MTFYPLQAFGLYTAFLKTGLVHEKRRHSLSERSDAIPPADYCGLLARQFLTRAACVTFPCGSPILLPVVEWTHNCPHMTDAEEEQQPRDGGRMSLAHLQLTSQELVASACKFIPEVRLIDHNDHLYFPVR